MNADNIQHETLYEITNGAKSLFIKYWEYFLDQYGIPFGDYSVKTLYEIYYNIINISHVNFFNVTLFLIKCIPTVMFVHRFLRNVYATSQEKMRMKQSELEDIQLQIQILETKIGIRDAQFVECEELLRRKLENLRKIRAQVRDIIADDDELKDAVLSSNEMWDEIPLSNSNKTWEEVSSDSKFIIELLRELKYDRLVMPGLDQEMLSCGEPSQDSASSETSVYSSALDGNVKQECHVKIVKVTNVYRVAYLRHFIKQKRLRRANRQALLRKKMENIKKLLEDWQKTLSMVINSKITLLNNSPQVELASQEAMGDCSKPNLYNNSDSDSDFINSADNFHDNYSVSWSQNQYSPMYAYNYDEFPGETSALRDYYNVPEYDKYNCHEDHHECNKGILYIVPEETSSQMEIKEIESNNDGSE